MQTSKYCPRCNSYGKIVTSANLRIDRAIRALVYKLVPGLYQSEKNRLVKFNSENNITPSTSYDLSAQQQTAATLATESIASPDETTQTIIPHADDADDDDQGYEVADEHDFFSPDEPIR